MIKQGLPYIPARLLEPGGFILETLWFTLDSPAEYITALILSLVMGSTAARTAYALLCRPLGLYNHDHYRLFPRLPWRIFYRYVYKPVTEWYQDVFKMGGQNATAKWASILSILLKMYKPGRFLVGRPNIFGFAGFQPIGLKDTGLHYAMIAGPGAGKSTHLQTLLAHHKGTFFLIDVDGTISNAIGSRIGKGERGIIGKGQRFLAIDTYGQTHDGIEKAFWCPVAQLDHVYERLGINGVVSFAFRIVDGLIIAHPKTEPIWPGTAKDFLLSLILWTWRYETRERTLLRVLHLLNHGLPVPDGRKDITPFFRLLDQMSGVKGDAVDKAIADGARAIMGSPERTQGSTLTNMRNDLKFLKLPSLAQIMSRSNFDLAELKTGNVSLAVCAPATDIQGPLAPFFRLLVICALYTFETVPAKLKHPCLFALDEAPSLGHVNAIAVAAPLFRKYGVRLLFISQSVSLIKKAYPEEWEEFLGSAQAVLWMKTGHETSLKVLVDRLGTYTHKRPVDDKRRLFRRYKGRYHYEVKPVMTEDQARRFLGRRRNMIVTGPEGRPMKLKAVPHYRELPVYLYWNDAKRFKEKPLRALSRALCRLVIGRPKRVPSSKKKKAPALTPEPAS